MNNLYKLNMRQISFYESCLSNKKIDEMFWMIRGHKIFTSLLISILNNIEMGDFDLNNLDEIIKYSNRVDDQDLKLALSDIYELKQNLKQQSKITIEQYGFMKMFYLDLFKKDLKVQPELFKNNQSFEDIKKIITNKDHNRNFKSSAIKSSAFNYLLFNNGCYSYETNQFWLFFNKNKLMMSFDMNDFSVANCIFNGELEKLTNIFKNNNLRNILSELSDDALANILNEPTKENKREHLLDLMEIKHGI